VERVARIEKWKVDTKI